MTLGDLVQAASRGDEAAWGTIVDRFSGLVWATARAHRLSSADASDVVQTTWLRLVEHFDRIREPEHLGAWLATTARNECLRLLRLQTRVQATDDPDLFEAPSDGAADAGLLTRERDTALWRAFAALNERCQSLLRLVASPLEPSYAEIGAALAMPIGAIGPTRARCLDRLRGELAAAEGTA
jgi:RNA polymerase sigma factor (sigma-70 family)